MHHSSAIAETHRRAAQRLLVLLVAILGMLVATTAVASASTASQPGWSSRSEALVVSETRVGVATTPAPLSVAQQSIVLPGQVGQTCPGYDRTTMGSCVATNTPVDDVVELYKGPQPGQATGPLNPKDFPGKAGAVPNGRAYFTPDKALAEQWAKQYGTQPIKVTMPRSAYDQMNNFLKTVPDAGEMRYLGGVAGQTEVLVPRWMIPWLNKFPIGPA